MRLIDALRIVNQPAAPGAPPCTVLMACGFTPLHLQTMLNASLRLALPHRQVAVRTGLYGDLFGTLEQADEKSLDAALVFLEWPDVDPRLGLRQLGGWGEGVQDDILREAEVRLARLSGAVTALAARVPVTVSTPTLTLPPAASTSTVEAGSFELQLHALVASHAADLSAQPGVVILNHRELDRLSPGSRRHDVASELATGFPYFLEHAHALAALAARTVAPPLPMKGLITDLDDTLWRGLVGEDGPEGVSWDLDHKSQMHGVYQQLLKSLADNGTLVAVASKNDPAIVEQAFERRDLHIRRSDLYPMEVHWQPKSASVAAILKTWNVGPESVLFIDDTPMEVEEVKAAHPQVDCRLFPKHDAAAVYELLHRIRDLFGKRHVTEEDRIRAASIRNAAALRRSAEDGAEVLDEFLATADARVAFAHAKEPADPRALELINKTNQFNLNGRRITESEWASYRGRDDTSVMVISYDDKFGPLGKIAVLAGRKLGGLFTVDTWVMSCRAFSRRIEHQTLREVLQRLGVDEVEFDFMPTQRNGPVRDLLTALTGSAPTGRVRLSRAQLERLCPELHHHLERTS